MNNEKNGEDSNQIAKRVVDQATGSDTSKINSLSREYKYMDGKVRIEVLFEDADDFTLNHILNNIEKDLGVFHAEQ